MLVKRVMVKNVRSFLDRTELLLDGPLSIVIGPNGGGKTNLLDAIVIFLRRHVFASMYAAHAPTAEDQNRYEFRHNDALNHMLLEKHSAGAAIDQVVEMELEVTVQDFESMCRMQTDADRLSNLASKKYINLPLRQATAWDLSQINSGDRFTYVLTNGNLTHDNKPGCAFFLQYLKMFELDSSLREEYELAPLSTPLVYLPVNRTATGFQSSVELAGYNAFEVKRQTDAVSSRSAGSIVNLAIGRLAQKYRLLLEKDQGIALSDFRNDANLQELTRLLGELGYEWSLKTINPLKNQYDVQLDKQGSRFLVSAASSGERELLTYLFAIFALNVRDAMIIVDEPELHLHPRWQRTLVDLFVRLSESTGNQFLLATHSPTFISPKTIQFVSRVFSQSQRSHILRLDTNVLPAARHLMNIVNSQINERLFFADEVVLVEGVSDRIFFEALFDRQGRSKTSRTVIEVLSVGGKGFFDAYAMVLSACKIPFTIISDLDYIEQVGTSELKALFAIDTREIKADVVDNLKSTDGDSLVRAIETAISSGSWEGAQHIWSYIKSRRRKLRADLGTQDRRLLDDFVDAKRAERLHILKLGALEAYLPPGHAGKDLNKLIQFVADPGFWDKLPPEGKDELLVIAGHVLDG